MMTEAMEFLCMIFFFFFRNFSKIRTRTVELSDPLADDPPAHGGVTLLYNNLQFFFTPVPVSRHSHGGRAADVDYTGFWGCQGGRW